MRSIKNITLGLATVGVMSLSGCAGDYLDTIPSTSVSETTINTSLDNLYIALNGIHKEMVSQESGYQCLGGEPGFMMSRDAEADDMNWQTNTWMKAAYLGWQCNMNETNGYNYKFWQIYYQWILNANKILAGVSVLGLILIWYSFMQNVMKPARIIHRMEFLIVKKLWPKSRHVIP